MKKFLLIVTIASLCHALEPKNNCMMPSIPIKMRNNSDIRAFNTAGDIYKSCIDKFIQDHRENVNNSMQSMRDAGADWSKFVKLVNNSPSYQQHVAPVTNSPVQLQTAPPVGGSHNVGHSDPTKAVMNFGF